MLPGVRKSSAQLRCRDCRADGETGLEGGDTASARSSSRLIRRSHFIAGQEGPGKRTGDSKVVRSDPRPHRFAHTRAWWYVGIRPIPHAVVGALLSATPGPANETWMRPRRGAAAAPRALREQRHGRPEPGAGSGQKGARSGLRAPDGRGRAGAGCLCAVAVAEKGLRSGSSATEWCADRYGVVRRPTVAGITGGRRASTPDGHRDPRQRRPAPQSVAGEPEQTRQPPPPPPPPAWKPRLLRRTDAGTSPFQARSGYVKPRMMVCCLRPRQSLRCAATTAAPATYPAPLGVQANCESGTPGRQRDDRHLRAVGRP